jgi:2,4-dienoyl-CoA reductase-like NADH-dependent reductase (Old Yellow Enzyme family)
MSRHEYKIFSEAQVGSLRLRNRLVRSGTWDVSVVTSGKVSNQVLDLYRELALGGVGVIITGDFAVMPPGLYDGEQLGTRAFSYDEIRIQGIDRLPKMVHDTAPDCKIIAQLSRGHPGPGPSDVPSPFHRQRTRPLTVEEIHTIVESFAAAVGRMRDEGFDGVQLHAAHGSLLSRFLSPHTNHRDDAYGGSVQRRVRILREIVSTAREKAQDLPIWIKMNCTDYIQGGTDIDTFPQLARQVEDAGVDAIEISGGMWDCLVRSEEQLGFRPVPAPESHTRIRAPQRQSYFLEYAERLDVQLPVILVGGNRDVERLEEIIHHGKVDLISLCRPLISEPHLPRRWLEGTGKSTADCISCNSCLYDMYRHLRRSEPWVANCLFKRDRRQVKAAQRWLSSWVQKNVVR